MKHIKQSLAILLSYTLTFMPLHAANLQTDGTTNTTIEKARNDVPVVNIANPNATGLSHNKFTNYNVDQQGLILNNSKDTTVNTQLGGYIFGNTNLTSNAKVILNEVTSTSRSQLNGYTEVAGQRADLIIANPNGLSVNGAGFINTSNVTLTTGVPIIDGGNLDSFNILGGDISIDGDGLDAMGPDSTSIYTHFLKLNAQIHTKNLDIKLGKNEIDAKTKQITSSTNSNEVALLLDASALGGMYANRISLVGTDKGLGVNLPPEVLASTGEITITNDGNIKLQSVKAKTNISVDAKSSDIEVKDTITAGSDIDLKAKDITNDALINSTNDLTITSENLTNNRTMFSGNDMFLYTKDTLTNNEDSYILAVNNLTMSANILDEKTVKIINDRASIQTLNGDINLYANTFENSGEQAEIGSNSIGSYAINLFSGGIFDDWIIEYDSGNGMNVYTGTLKYLKNVQKNLRQAGKYHTVVNEHWRYSDGSMVSRDEGGMIIDRAMFRNGKLTIEEIGLYINEIFYPKSELINYRELGFNMVYFTYQDRSGLEFENNNQSKPLKHIYNDNDIILGLEQYYKNYDLTVEVVSTIFSTKTYKLKKGNYPANALNVNLTNTVNEDYMISSPEKFSKLASGNNLNINADNIKNYYSEISSANEINFLNPTGNINNLAETLYKHNTKSGMYEYKSGSGGWFSGASYSWAALPTTTSSEVLEKVFSTIQAGKNITGTSGSVSNGFKENAVIPSSTNVNEDENDITYKNPDGTTIISTPKDKYGLFVKTKNPLSAFLIETNPEFALYENFISSDYMMSHIDYDSESTIKRLGDALYENTIIRDSIFKQTGRRFLNKDIKNDNDQYKHLMDNAIAASKSLDLSPGISLSKEQINALTQDIVWMEEKEVEGIKVLVPVVYIADVNSYKLKGSQIITGNDINLKVASLKNSGTLEAGQSMRLQASDAIVNIDGTIKANEDITLQATNDISNISANIKAKNINLASTDGSVLNKRYTKNVSYGSRGGTDNKVLIGASATIEASNSLNIDAKDKVVVQGSKLEANDINVDAKNIELVTTIEKKDFFGGNSKNYTKEKSTTHLASNINAQNININSTGTTAIKGSNLDASNNLDIKAKKIDVLAVNNSTYKETKETTEGFMSSSTTLDSKLTENVQSSKLNAKNIILESENDVNIESVNINAKDSVDVSSKNGNVNLLAKSYTNATFHEKTSSSFGGLVGSHSIDSISKTKLGDSSTKANNNIVIGGKNINILANDLTTNQGDIKLSAVENVNIISGTEKKEEQHLKESTGLSLGVSGSKLTYAKKTKDETVDETITNKASNIKTNNLIIKSGQDTNVIASNITSDSMQVDAKRDFNVLSDKNTQRKHKEHSTQELGFELTLNEKEASLFAGYWEEANGETIAKSSVAQSNMEIGSLDVASKNTNIVGSNIYTNDMKIDSENINVIADRTNTNVDTYTKSIKAGVSVGVSQNISNAVDAIEDQGRAKSNSAIVSRGLKTYDAITSAIKKPVQVGVKAIYEESRTNTNSKNDEIVSSNLHANNSIILNAKEDIEIAGSNIASENELKLNAKNINLHSAKQNYSYDTSSSSINAKANIFGTNMGDVTIGAQTSDLNIEATQEINSHIYAKGKATITSKEDTTLKGATVDANELEVNVGRNLVMQSIQDSENTRGSSKGGSISGNVITMTPTGISGNIGTTKGSKKWVSEVTSLNANEKIKVTVNEKTTLSGASITNLDGDAKDKSNLEFSTKTLEINDVKDHDTYASTTMGIGLGSNDSKPSLNSMEYTKNTKDKEQITRATVGDGTITTTSDISNLNRDTTKIKQITKDESSNLELYASENSIKAILNPVKAKDEFLQDAKDMGLNVHKEILENIPSGKNSASNTGNKVKDAINNVVNNTIGEVLDAVSTAGVLPSQENGGGYITQIATQLFGDNRNVLVVKDRNKLIEAGIADNDIQKMTLVKTKKGIKKISEVEDATGLERLVVWTTNPNKAVRIDEQPIVNDSLKDYKIHVSSNDIKNAGLDHIFTNGMFNNSDTAIYNQQTQQGYADGLLNYNQQHGILGDIIEDAQDHITSNTGMSFLGTGGSRQTGEAIKQMTVITKGNLVVGAHSQGTMMSQNGLAQNKEEIAKIVQNNPDSKFLVGYAGSPVNHKVSEGLVTDIYGGEAGIRLHIEKGKIDDVFRSHVSPQDAVGSFLGWQSAGINNSEQLGSNVWSSFISTPMLFGVGGDSSHSYYPCVIGCSDERKTPKKDFYFNSNINKEIPLIEYYKTLNVDTTLYTGEKK